ncbi:MAG: hypothetical protein JO133_09105 [Burkholderiaceae bacterium]|nr:hypothetical protein [Burkholderiaceae bacterium]
MTPGQVRAALIGLAALSSVPAVHAVAPVGPPSISGVVISPKELVFDTRTGCEQIDIPDAPARAFRDNHGTVHLVASHFVARAMTGPSLNRLKRDCRAIYRSPQDRDPSHFKYKNWLFSFFSEDGRRFAALVHSEFDADEIPGMCATPKDSNNCWWNTVTFAQSLDGGYNFLEPAPPRNLVAALPYRYVVGNRASAYGYAGPTNILKVDKLYYALINDWPYKAQQYGPCLIRTSNVFDPASWRAWDGKAFTIRFADPYREKIAKPEEHVCPPVFAGSADTLLQHAGTGNFVTTQFAPDNRFGGAAGFYVQVSRDLMHWSKPSLLVPISALLASDGAGKWTYGYDSLLDPTSIDRNFSIISDTPYLYYVRMDGKHPPYVRALFRRKIKLQIQQ